MITEVRYPSSDYVLLLLSCYQLATATNMDMEVFTHTRPFFLNNTKG